MRIQSVLIGAALAAVVILPARADDNNWVTGPWKTYDAKALTLENVVANVKVDVKDSGPMVLQISGLRERVNSVHVDASGGTLTVACANPANVWDWRHWFDFSWSENSKPSQLRIIVAVPRGSAVNVESIAGNATIGNTDGPLHFSVEGDSESRIGNVSEAHLSMAGSGKLFVGNVAGALHASTAGSGDMRIGDAQEVHASIAGSGSIATGRIRGPLQVSIAGSGDFSAASVQGPTHVSIAGSGSVSITGGEANPMHVDIMGSGSVTFDGTAVDPKISSMGSGSVRVKACRGDSCSQSGLKVGG